VQSQDTSRSQGVRRTIPVYLLLFSFATIVIVGRLLYSGEKYELDYNIFQPDGVCYTKKALDFAKVDLNSVKTDLIQAYPNIKYETILALDCKSVNGRILYPLLSVPFVKLFGVAGMLAIPILSYLLMFLLLIIGLNRIKVSTPTLMVTCVFVLMSSTLSRWYISNIVDSLLITLCYWLIYLLVTKDVFDKFKYVFLVSFIIFAMALTKRSLHLVLICAFVFSLHLFRRVKAGHRLRNLKKFVASFILLPTFLDILIGRVLGRQNGLKSIIDTEECLSGQTASLCEEFFKNSIGGAVTGWPSKIGLLGQTLLNLVEISVNYLFVSVGQIFVVDLPLAVIFVFWIFSIRRMTKNLTLLNLFALVSPILIALVASLNGTPGLNFRFEMAFFFPVFLALAKIFDNLIQSPKVVD
jgi:hypothetical protein